MEVIAGTHARVSKYTEIRYQAPSEWDEPPKPAGILMRYLTIARKRRGGRRPAVSSSSSLLIGMVGLSLRTTVIAAAACVLLE